MHGAARHLIWHFIRNGGMRPPRLEGLETFADGEELDVPGGTQNSVLRQAGLK